MKAQNKVSVIGIPSFVTDVFNSSGNSVGELTIRLTVDYNGKVYVRLPVLRLAIERYGEVVHVNDYYSNFIPYLKPIKAFRTYLWHWLQKFLSDNPDYCHDIIGDGVLNYSDELKSYSDVKGLVREAKSRVNGLSHDRKDAERQARAVLAALGVTPHTDVAFELKA